jgi:hypothetical protein
LWQIPYTRALKYVHAALWGNGAVTVKNKMTPSQEFTSLLEMTKTLIVLTEDGDDI